tara:strand:- start:10186 stop:13134 length:2949 start_codon:yes stop_codon:yes gene_type:complete
MHKEKVRSTRKGIFKIPKVGALCSIVFLVAFSTVSSAQETINIGAVYFAQTHLSEPTEAYFTLVSDRKTLVKAHVTHPDQIGAPVVKAIVTVDGQVNEIILAGPANLPVSFESDIYKIQHSYDDGSFTGFIPKEWLKAGMTVKIETGEQVKEFNNLEISAPTVLKMTVFEIACFEESYTDFPAGWEQEFESRIPVAELQANSIRIYWPEFVQRPQDGNPAKRVFSKSESKNGGSDMFKLIGVLQKAAGADHKKLYYLSINNLSLGVGGLGGGFRALGGAGGVGYIAHEGGHALGLPHANNSKHPYKEGTYSGVYVKKEWVGPNWGFSLWNEKFMTIYKSEKDTYRGTPMLGGGKSDGVYDWLLLKHFSDYEVNKMKKKLEDLIVTWNSSLNSWAKWDPMTNDYTATVENDGVRYPVKRDVDVVTVLTSTSAVTAEANIIYPPIGPYNTGLIRLFDPQDANDRAEAQIIYNKQFDYTLRIHQGNQQKYVMIPVAHAPNADPLDKNSLKSYAVNLPAEDGEVTKVELLLTLGAQLNGLPAEETIITDWPETTSYNPDPGPEPEPTDFLVIDTPEQLIWLSSSDLDFDNDDTDDFADIEEKMAANYLLGADIIFAEDETTVDWNNDGVVNGNDAAGLLAIGIDTKYTGHFNGQYYTIQNAFQNASKIGLFHQVNGATIEKLKLVDFDFSCDSTAGGGIVGEATGVANVFHQLVAAGSLDYTSSAASNLAVGGVVGSMIDATVTECVAIVSYLGIDTENKGKNAGGLIGKDEGGSTITDCYSVSTIYGGGKQMAGLLGKTLGVLEIKNSYSASSVTNSFVDFTEYGSFAGRLGAATVVSSFFDSEIQADGVGVGTGDNAADVIGLTTAEFNDQSKFVGWDFDATWKMGTVNGVARPVLQWQGLAPLSVDEINVKGSLVSVYPNPVTSLLTIENAPMNATFSLINSLGQEVISGTVEGTNKQLNVESYSNGIYILRVGDIASKIVIE